MLDKTRMNECQSEPMIDERFSDTKEHKLAMVLHAASSAAGALYEMSMDPEYRDLMVDEAGQVSDIALAISLTWSRVRRRSAA